MGTSAWFEVGDGVFYRRYESVNVNVGLVVGGDGALLVDTRAAPSQGFETAGHVRDLTSLPIRWVVNTHHHWDHTFGNGAFFEADIWGHTACRRAAIENDEQARAQAATWEPDLADELVGGSAFPPDHLVDEVATVDLGGRSVTMSYHGRAHTAGDVVVKVDGVPSVFAGDILESSGPPWFGDGYPIAWPTAVAAVLDTPADRFMPGHGSAMSMAEAETQLEELRAVARVCRRAFDDGASPDEASLSGAPYPEATMREALARGIAELRAEG